MIFLDVKGVVRKLGKNMRLKKTYVSDVRSDKKWKMIV